MVNNVEKTDVEKITFLGKGFGESFILHKSDWGKQVAENVEYMEANDKITANSPKAWGPRFLAIRLKVKRANTLPNILDKAIKLVPLINFFIMNIRWNVLV